MVEAFEEQWQVIAEQMYDAPMYWCEAGWEAALKWVLSRVETSNSDGSIIQDIKDELRD